MDPITHLTSGALQGQLFRKMIATRWIFLFCGTAALLPDADNLTGLINPEFYLIHHRGITHSLLGGVFLSLLLSGLFRLFKADFPFWRGAVAAYAGILAHIFLDLITSYGTQIFAPFTRHRYEVACVFIIDPFYTLSLLLLFAITCLSRRRRRVVAVLGLAWLVSYPMINLGVRTGLERSLEGRLSRQGASFHRIHVTTDAFTPLFWKVIVENDSTYSMAVLSLLDPERRLSYETFQKADAGLMKRLGERASLFKTYAWFAAYPVMERVNRKGGSAVIFSDLRFHSGLEFVRRRFRGGRVPFTLTALLDENGTLVRYEYSRPRSTRFIQHLE